MKNQHLHAAAVSAFALAFTASAQLNYADNDVILAFRQTSLPTTDLVIDIGSVDSLVSLAPRTSPYSISTTSTLASSPGGSSISSTLLGTYGVGGSLPSGIAVTAIANDYNGSAAASGYIINSLFLSKTRTTDITGLPSKVAGSAAYQTGDDNTQGLISSTIDGFANNVGTTFQSQGTSYVKVAPSSSYSYSYHRNNNYYGTFYENNETVTTGSGKISFDFYFLPSSPVGSPSQMATYLGFFSLDSQAHLTFVPAGSVVPEPREYAIVGSLGLVGFAIWRRRASK